MTKTLLVEIGVEELPASFVARALADLPKLLGDALAGARIQHGATRVFGTPRRLAIEVRDVALSQPDLKEDVLGPPKAAAFEADGRPKKAAEGFAKKFGLGVEAVRITSTDKGEYAVLTREERGRPSVEVLPALVEGVARSIQFQKTMRWGVGEYGFGRPVQWFVVLFGDEVLPAKFVGVTSGRDTLGHRFLAPSRHAIANADAYVETLRAAKVRADVDERRRVMLERIDGAAAEAGGAVVPDAFLVDENLSLVEEPYVIAGSFEERFLAIPDEVIVAVMRGHQRYFAVRSVDGTKLLPRYLAVVNTANDPQTIVRGNDRVLRARLSDARFFVEEDRKRGSASWVPKLDGVVFQTKLGSIGEKVKRIARLAERTSGDPRAAAGARLAKADLVSYVVGEFPELQGSMGRYYALAEGVEPAVADVIANHYLPKGASDAPPPDALSAHVGVADRIDTLVGCFGVGLSPSGSADPFALRRAVNGIVRIAIDGPIDVRFGELVALAYDEYEAQGKKLTPREELFPKLDEFVRGRLRNAFGDDVGIDVVDACLAAWDGQSLRDLRARVRALAEVRKDAVFESLATAFKRAWNIAKDVEPGEISPALFDHDRERELGAKFAAVEAELQRAAESGAYEQALRLVATELHGPIDRFFTDVFVMVDDPAIRTNRLRLLSKIARSLHRVAHFHLLGGTSA